MLTTVRIKKTNQNKTKFDKLGKRNNLLRQWHLKYSWLEDSYQTHVCGYLCPYLYTANCGYLVLNERAVSRGFYGLCPSCTHWQAPSSDGFLLRHIFQWCVLPNYNPEDFWVFKAFPFIVLQNYFPKSNFYIQNQFQSTSLWYILKFLISLSTTA